MTPNVGPGGPHPMYGGGGPLRPQALLSNSYLAPDGRGAPSLEHYRTSYQPGVPIINNPPSGLPGN